MKTTRLLPVAVCLLALATRANGADPKDPAMSKNPKDNSAQSSLSITTFTVSLTVDDVVASSRFLVAHFGFTEKMAAEGFAFLVREDASINVVFLRRGMTVLPEGFRDQRAAGVILAFTVPTGSLAGEERRLREAGVKITSPLQEDPWGERLFQVTDPNGVVIQLVEWVTPAKEWVEPAKE